MNQDLTPQSNPRVPGAYYGSQAAMAALLVLAGSFWFAWPPLWTMFWILVCAAVLWFWIARFGHRSRWAFVTGSYVLIGVVQSAVAFGCERRVIPQIVGVAVICGLFLLGYKGLVEESRMLKTDVSDTNA